MISARDYWLLDTGYWMLVTGCWLLDAGYWMLVTGYYDPEPCNFNDLKLIYS